MSELLQAAKTMVEWFESTTKEDAPVDDLRAAVERAEKQDVAEFEEWWGQTEIWPSEYTAAASAWIAAQLAERERIKDIVDTIGVQGEHDAWFDACVKIMEAIDDL